MNKETHEVPSSARASAFMVAKALEQLENEHQVSCWLLSTALREVQRLEGEDMTEASALLQALYDRLQDCRALYFVQDQAKELLAELEREEARHE